MINEIESYQKFIEKSIKEYNIPVEPSNLYDPIRYILKLGGKRMRPVLTLMSCEMFDRNFEKSKAAAVAIEFFHNFTLIHDDIMDQAPLRRGKKTIHTKWNENIAILSGDTLLVEAYKNLAKYSGNEISKLLPLFNTTAVQVCEGQQMDMDFEEENQVTIQQYLEMIKLKTAVLLGCSLKMGAIIGGAGERAADELYNFGVNLGIAFQLQDDILDVYADESKFGKQVGGDIVAKKKTYLLITAFNKSARNQKKRLDELFKERDDEKIVNGVKEICEELGIRELAEAQMGEFYTNALNNFTNINVSDERKMPLRKLANFLMNREK